MASRITSVVRCGLTMRETFSIEGYSVAQWFPGHMNKGMLQMQSKLQSVDCVIEIHDARIPLSGRNPLFESKLLGLKPHMLVLNKMDLVPSLYRKKVLNYYEKLDLIKNVLFTNCKKPDSKEVKIIVPTALKLIEESNRYNRTDHGTYNIMVIGIPNVGKSSFINVLRARNLHRAKATSVGAVPGVTRSVLEKIKVHENPIVYLYDTPGIMMPKIESVETGLKLTLAATILDHLVGDLIIADYLLYMLNKQGIHSYVEHLEIDKPTDNIYKVLMTMAMKRQWFKTVRSHSGRQSVPDVIRCAKVFVSAFRNGALGLIPIDDIP